MLGRGKSVQLTGPATAGLKDLSQRRRATLGAQWLGVGATSRVGAQTVPARDTPVVQSKREGAQGLNAEASNHTAAVLTTPTRINGVRVRQR